MTAWKCFQYCMAMSVLVCEGHLTICREMAICAGERFGRQKTPAPFCRASLFGGFCCSFMSLQSTSTCTCTERVLFARATREVRFSGSKTRFGLQRRPRLTLLQIRESCRSPGICRSQTPDRLLATQAPPCCSVTWPGYSNEVHFLHACKTHGAVGSIVCVHRPCRRRRNESEARTRLGGPHGHFDAAATVGERVGPRDVA